MPGISVKSNIEEVLRWNDRFVRDQVPYAASVALNKTAFDVREAEIENLFKVFDGVTPFTKGGMRYEKATKRYLVASVYVEPDVRQDYLLPYEIGGRHFLGTKRALIEPKAARVNQYGNLPRNALRNAKAKPGVFVGTVKTAKGSVGGVWQRTPARRGNPGGLKLLMRFTDPLPVKEHLNFQGVAFARASAVFTAHFEAAMVQAIATAR